MNDNAYTQLRHPHLSAADADNGKVDNDKGRGWQQPIHIVWLSFIMEK